MIKVFIVTVDVPFIDEETFHTRLIEQSKHNIEITIAKDSKYTHNLCGVFSKSLLPLIEKLLNEDIHKINTLIKNSNKL